MPGVVWLHWSPVNVDADEVVDGGAEEDNHEAGHGVAHLPAQPPPAHQPRVTSSHVSRGVTSPSPAPPAHAQGVEGDDDAAAEVGAGQRHHDQVKPLQTRGG